jgi:uncharacterized membrane protein
MQEATPAQKSPVKMGEWITKAWDLVVADLGFYILVGLVYLVVIIVASTTVVGELIILGPLTVGFFYILFRKMTDRQTDIGDLAKGFNVFIPALISGILVSVFVSIGLILCILPGLVVAAIYMFTPAFLAEKKLDFWQAMEASRQITQKYWFELSVFYLLLFLISLAGALLCGIGLLFTTPLCFAAVAFAYDDMVGIIREEKEAKS